MFCDWGGEGQWGYPDVLFSDEVAVYGLTRDRATARVEVNR